MSSGYNMNVIKIKNNFFHEKKIKKLISGTFVVYSVNLNEFSDKYIKNIVFIKFWHNMWAK